MMRYAAIASQLPKPARPMLNQNLRRTAAWRGSASGVLAGGGGAPVELVLRPVRYVAGQYHVRQMYEVSQPTGDGDPEQRIQLAPDKLQPLVGLRCRLVVVVRVLVVTIVQRG
jgi:hypothetical protein